MEGVGNTVKVDELVMVTPLVVTEIVPEDAPEGTEVVMLLAVDEVTTAVVPLNDTMGEGLKLLPLIVTTAPTAPLPIKGLMSEMVGVGNTLNDDPLVATTPFRIKEIVPSDAPIGTVVVMLLEVEAVTTAATPLNSITLSAGVILKLFPESIIVAPTAPLFGVNPEIDGVGDIVKSSILVILTPLTVIEIFPDEAPTGTIVVMLLEVEAVTTEAVLLNSTMWSPGVFVKLVPEIVTVAPMAPLVGLKPVMVGVGNTVKLDELVIVKPLDAMDIGPVRAPAGTTVVILVVFEDTTLAATPLNDTEGDPLKFVPDITIVAPTAPFPGLKPERVGVSRTTKFEDVETVTPLTLTEINPVVAPTGTVVVMFVSVE